MILCTTAPPSGAAALQHITRWSLAQTELVVSSWYSCCWICRTQTHYDAFNESAELQISTTTANQKNQIRQISPFMSPNINFQRAMLQLIVKQYFPVQALLESPISGWSADPSAALKTAFLMSREVVSAQTRNTQRQ